ncbi:MAG: AAA family ATPase [Nanoarchaeota archaeon]
MKNALVVNLFAGPGCGKSTMMASIFSELKWKGYECEMSTEYAKDKVWEGSSHVLNNQVYITGKQYHKLYNLKNKIDIIVTDSPLLLGLYYGKNEPLVYKEMILTYFKQFNNFNIVLEREKKYNPNGRNQSEEEAKFIDDYIKKSLDVNNIDYIIKNGNKKSVDSIVSLIEDVLTI